MTAESTEGHGPSQAPSSGYGYHQSQEQKTTVTPARGLHAALVCPPGLGMDTGPGYVPLHVPGSCRMKAGLVANQSRYAVQEGANSLAASELQMNNGNQDLAQPLAFPWLSILLRNALYLHHLLKYTF